MKFKMSKLASSSHLTGNEKELNLMEHQDISEK